MIELDKPFVKKGDRLVVLGDSITANPAGYIRSLTARLAARGIEVVNAGRSGDKTPWALTRLEPDVVEAFPDAVAIYLGANDAAVGRGRWADEPTVAPTTYGDNLRWMVHLLRQRAIERVSVVTPPMRFEGPAWAEHGDILRDYALAARAAADEMRAHLVPLDVAFEQAWQSRPAHTGTLLTRDGIHPNDLGQALIVKTMLEAWGVE